MFFTQVTGYSSMKSFICPLPLLFMYTLSYEFYCWQSKHCYYYSKKCFTSDFAIFRPLAVVTSFLHNSFNCPHALQDNAIFTKLTTAFSYLPTIRIIIVLRLFTIEHVVSFLVYLPWYPYCLLLILQ